MHSDRKDSDKEHWYICGRCKTEQYALIDEETPVPCVICGYAHRDRKQYDVPSEVKLRIN